MADISWERYPHLIESPSVRAWLTIQVNLGHARNTVEAYARSLEDYLTFCTVHRIEPQTADRGNIAAYVHDLAQRPNPRGDKIRVLDSRVGLANATIQLRLTAIRLYYDYLMEEGFRENNPVGRGRYTPGNAYAGKRERGLVPRFHKLPWIPNDEEWLAILQTVRQEPIRTRVMVALAYDAALRREELCALQTGDIDPAHRLVQVRAEYTKNRLERVVPYSADTGILYASYLSQRRALSLARGPLFLSESRRNRAQPISIWTWSKVVERIAERAQVPRFTTHTFRHLCLTDLARDDWDIHEIATFAGHRSIESTLRYIHLSGRDLSAKIERGMAQIHSWRIKLLMETLM
jgi:integrase/recombinase XerD